MHHTVPSQPVISYHVMHLHCSLSVHKVKFLSVTQCQYRFNPMDHTV